MTGREVLSRLWPRRGTISAISIRSPNPAHRDAAAGAPDKTPAEAGGPNPNPNPNAKRRMGW